MLLAVGLLVGAALGIVVTLVVMRRRDAADQRPAGADTQPIDPVAPDVTPVESVLETALEQLDLAVVVRDGDDRTVFRNRAATTLSDTHVGVLLDSAVDEIVSAADSGERVERRVGLHGPPRASLLLTAQRTERGMTVVIVEDVGERERIDAMRTDFVANISHELKTPVGAIAVLADALLGETESAVVDRVAGRIVEESERAVTTIDDLLELARIETAEPVREIVDIHDVVHAAIARGRTVDESKGVGITAFDAQEPIWIRCDPRQMASAVGNLVENAVKYSDPDGVVQVRTRRDDRWVEIMVADQGVGIPSRDVARVFERFYRVDRARSRSTGGTGLGLSIVRHVVTGHGGDVQVSSTEGEGSTFVLRLPASLVAAAPASGDGESDDERIAADGAVVSEGA